MRAYTRPSIEPQEFLDASGQPIPYGTRWAHLGGSPPVDTYSVDSHAERFAPLHTIATALIDHLAATYDVEVDENPALAEAALHPPLPGSIVRAVSFRPASAECAALLIVFTAFPSVRIYAGAFRTTAYPHCSCDACDETWQLVADDLEGEVLSIAAGGLAETIGRRRWLRWSYRRGQGIFVAMRQPVTTGLI
ncbi:hypothetical protein JT358_09380 [Micrococcales bacterium 31B]|nr:hypothetical protein [Micrococcales bacterium 31B]